MSSQAGSATAKKQMAADARGAHLNDPVPIPNELTALPIPGQRAVP
jgi:hypothetical protein